MTHDEMMRQIVSVCDIYTDDPIASTGATQLILGIVKQRITALEAENTALKAQVTQLEMETNLLSDVATRQTLLFEGADCANDILNDLSNELEAENAKLRAALQSVEWIAVREKRGWKTVCAYCGWHKVGGKHAPDCQRQAALSQTSEVKHG